MIVVVALWMLSAQLPPPPAPLDPAAGDAIVDDQPDDDDIVDPAAAPGNPPGDKPPAPGAPPPDPAGPTTEPEPAQRPTQEPAPAPKPAAALPPPEAPPPPASMASAWLMPSAAAGAFLGTTATVSLGVVLIATGGTVALASDPNNKVMVELLGLGVLAAAPALGGLLAGAGALFFLDATANDWLTMALCTGLAWVGTLGIVALAAVGLVGGGAGCNPGSCGSGCGNCGSGSSAQNDDDGMFGSPAHGAAAGAVFGAFLGGAGLAGLTFVSVEDRDDPNLPLWTAAAFAAGAAAGAPLGAVVGVSVME